MAARRRQFKRPAGERRYRKLFIIAVEGLKTEPEYFAVFNSRESVIQVKCIKGDHASSPNHVLKRMEKYLSSERLLQSDEAWLVVDKDSWSDEQLMLLHNWAKKAENHGLALSNPNFEFWLLLHFESGKAVFELKRDGHHDHLVCLQCGRVEEFYDAEIEKRQVAIAKERGFKLQEHSLSLYADCIKPACPHRK
ncbi:MAG: RloB domain-containing protein [Ignavibacteriaceae bacterium]|nr:RloB domain-containing protein [Ignavibacteriaceae bacterium]